MRVKKQERAVPRGCPRLLASRHKYIQSPTWVMNTGKQRLVQLTPSSSLLSLQKVAVHPVHDTLSLLIVAKLIVGLRITARRRVGIRAGGYIALFNHLACSRTASCDALNRLWTVLLVQLADAVGVLPAWIGRIASRDVDTRSRRCQGLQPRNGESVGSVVHKGARIVSPIRVVC